MGIQLSDRQENMVEKGKNCSLRAVSSFPIVFSKAVCWLWWHISAREILDSYRNNLENFHENSKFPRNVI